MRIVICDDDQDAILSLENSLFAYFKKKKLDTPDISKYQSAEDMLSRAEIYDLAFLDVEMPGLSGIGAIKELRNRNKNLLIFIVTSHETSYLDEAMEEGVYRYMMKPLNTLQLQANLSAALRRFRSFNRKVTVETDQGMMSFNTDEIIMVYTERRNTIVKTCNDTYKTTQSFSFWEESLPEFSFATSHKGVIVNLEYVRRVDGNMIEMLNTKEPAYLSVRNKAMFKKKFMQYMNSIN